MHKAPDPKPGRCFVRAQTKGEKKKRKKGYLMIAEPAPAQFRNITLPQISEKIV